MGFACLVPGRGNFCPHARMGGCVCGFRGYTEVVYNHRAGELADVADANAGRLRGSAVTLRLEEPDMGNANEGRIMTQLNAAARSTPPMQGKPFVLVLSRLG